MDCYGHYGAKKARTNCANCEFGESCQYYTNSPLDPGKKSNIISLDAGSFNQEGYEGMDHSEPGLPDVRLTLHDLAEFARFLLELDDFSLGMVAEVVRGSRSVSELAKAAGVSRQYVHCRLLGVVSRVPALAKLFAPVMPKLTAARRRFLFGTEKSSKRRRSR